MEFVIVYLLILHLWTQNFKPVLGHLISINYTIDRLILYNTTVIIIDSFAFPNTTADTNIFNLSFVFTVFTTSYFYFDRVYWCARHTIFSLQIPITILLDIGTYHCGEKYNHEYKYTQSIPIKTK